MSFSKFPFYQSNSQTVTQIYIHIDIFQNWPNSLPTAQLQMIGHALFSTNFNTLQTHLPRWSCGIVLVSLGFKSQHRQGNFLILKNFFCQLPFGKKNSIRKKKEMSNGIVVNIPSQKLHLDVHLFDCLPV